MEVDSSVSNSDSGIDRFYMGADLQLYYELPVIGNFSLRGEYIPGEQPGLAASNNFYNSLDANTALYYRNFSGYYIFYG